MDKSGVIDLLNEIQKWEWTGVSQYMQYSFMVRGTWREVYASKFRDGADESLGHAKKIGEKIVALGGVPTLERAEVKQSVDLEEMLRHSLDFEQKAVDLYNKAIAAAEDWGNRALVVMLEDILVDEQDGVDELTKLLSSGEASSTSRSATRAG